jgi:hypothetical protein
VKQLTAERDRIDEQITDMMNVRDRLNGVINTAQNFETECPRTR